MWQVMTRLGTEEMIDLSPIFVPGQNLLSGTSVECKDGEIEISSQERKCWILDQDKGKVAASVSIICIQGVP